MNTSQLLFCCVCQEYVSSPHHCPQVVRGIATEIVYSQETTMLDIQLRDVGRRAAKYSPKY